MGTNENSSRPTAGASIAIFTGLFPSARQPLAGLFIRERMFRVCPPERLVVVVPQPWFPFQGLIRRLRPGYRPQNAPYERQQGVDVYFPRFLSVPGLFRRLDGLSMALCTWPMMRRLKRERGLDAIDAHFAYPAGDAATRLGRWLSLPVAITMRGTEVHYLASGRTRRVVLRALQRAARVFSVSDSLRKAAVSAGAAPEHIHVVGNGVDLQRFRRQPKDEARRALGLHPQAPILISVGGLVERKGFHRVIELLPALLPAFPGLQFLIVGGGSPEGDIEARLREQVRTLGLEETVRFLGPMQPHLLSGPLSAADVFVLATSNEGWANVLLEAMACGLPVVATDVGGNREVVCEASLGLIVPFGEPALLRDALIRALRTNWNGDYIVEYARSNEWGRRVEVLRDHFAALCGRPVA